MNEEPLPEQSTPGQRGAVPDLVSWVVIGGGLVGVLVALLVFSGGGAEPPPGAGEELPTLPIPTPRTVVPATTPQAAATVIAGRQMLAVGQLFEDGCFSHGPNVSGGSTREAALVVELRGRGPLYLNRGAIGPWHVERVTERSAQMTATVNGRFMRLFVMAGTPDTGLQEVPAGEPSEHLRIFSAKPETRPVVMLYLQDETGVPLHMEIDCAGQLYVSASPIAREAVIEFWTGERLGIEAARPVGTLRSPAPSPPPRYGTYWTDCQGTRCTAVWRGGLVRLPQPGRLQCREDGAWLYDPLNTEGITLVFVEIVEATGGRGCERGFDRSVAAGEYLPQAGYRVSARGPDGERVDVAIAIDGTVYAGEIRPTSGCPCRFGPQ